MLPIRRVTKSGFKLARGPFCTDHAERGRSLVIELHPSHVAMRLKGCRQRLILSYSSMWLAAAFKETENRRKAAGKARRHSVNRGRVA
jgi:hypothetical protein